MKIATWNVNSLRVRLPHVLQFLQDEQCDVIGLQETKVDDDKFPEDEIRKLGYSCLFSGHKAYNGVAILTRDESVAVSDASFGIPGYPDPQKRLAAATITAQSGASFRFVCGYFPNGQARARRSISISLSGSARSGPRLKRASVRTPTLFWWAT